MSKARYLKNVPHFFEDIFDPRTQSKRRIQVVDAVDPLDVEIGRQDVWGATTKAGAMGGLSKCVQDNGAGRIKGVYLVQTTNTLSKIIFTKNIWVAYRYELPEDGVRVAKINDDLKKGKKELLKIVPIKLTYKPPRWNRSIECSQSDEMRELRAESRERRYGETARAYSVPTESGYRDARRWYARGTRPGQCE